MQLNRIFMLRKLIYATAVILLISCASRQAENQQKNQVTIKEGTYKAEVNLDNVDPDMKGYHMTSQISFGFESDNTFIYTVKAMGRDIDDVGQWEIRGDSLYIFNLERGPNTAFKLEQVGEDSYSIQGPNHFILTKEEPQ